MNYFDYYSSPFSSLLLVEKNNAIICISLEKDRDAVPYENGSREATPVMIAAKKQLAEYFNGTRQEFDLPLAPEGTPFQRKVWSALCTIPYGETKSYKEIAVQVENPKGSRAIGMANNKNPIMIVVPCHRVIGANGSLTGYAGGLDVKQWLLAHEQKFVNHRSFTDVSLPL